MELHSDNDRNFEPPVFWNVRNTPGIRKTRTSPLHPRSHGMVEHFNKTVKGPLRMFVSGHQEDYDQNILMVMMAYMLALHEPTGWTSSGIIFGKELTIENDLVFDLRLAENLKCLPTPVQQKLFTIHIA